MEWLFPLFALVFIGVITAVNVRSFAAGRRAWGRFGAEHGLVSRGSYFSPGLEGRYAGAAIEVELVHRGSGRSRSHYTKYRVTIDAPMPSGLHVRKEGLLHLLGKVVGVGDDIQVGDPELDDALMITGNDMVRIIRLLNIPRSVPRCSAW
jgi:hypothetical protein